MSGDARHGATCRHCGHQRWFRSSGLSRATPRVICRTGASSVGAAGCLLSSHQRLNAFILASFVGPRLGCVHLGRARRAFSRATTPLVWLQNSKGQKPQNEDDKTADDQPSRPRIRIVGIIRFTDIEGSLQELKRLEAGKTSGPVDLPTDLGRSVSRRVVFGGPGVRVMYRNNPGERHSLLGRRFGLSWNFWPKHLGPLQS